MSGAAFDWSAHSAENQPCCGASPLMRHDIASVVYDADMNVIKPLSLLVMVKLVLVQPVFKLSGCAAGENCGILSECVFCFHRLCSERDVLWLAGTRLRCRNWL